MRQQRYYGALNETRREIDEEQAASAQAAEDRTATARPVRTWTHHGDMVSQQASAHKWIRQNREIRMAANDKSGSGRDGEGAASAQDRAQAEAEIAEARAAVEEARRREAAERARQQERDRGSER